MTLCIAAKAQFQGEPRIAFCTDFLVSNDYSQSEDTSKYEQICDGLMALFAGPLARARELLRIYKKQLEGKIPSDGDVFELLTAPMTEFKKRVAARGLESDVEVLIFGFVESQPRIFYISQNHGNVEEENFVHAIGSGAYAALAMLNWRGLTEATRLDQALYFLYESKKLAEAGPPVGKNVTMLAYVAPTPTAMRLTPIYGKAKKVVTEAFDTFGPRMIDPDWHLSDLT